MKPLKFLSHLRARPSGDGKATAYIVIPRHTVELWERDTGHTFGNLLGQQVKVEVEVEL